MKRDFCGRRGVGKRFVFEKIDGFYIFLALWIFVWLGFDFEAKVDMIINSE